MRERRRLAATGLRGKDAPPAGAPVVTGGFVGGIHGGGIHVGGGPANGEGDRDGLIAGFGP